ncbi:uncharacterized protein METZ01_LOCUS10390 [marine metagenome]|uniref:Uncharacterized protein n=1 Tax=marine metagenome TaxID=408172 RepID=A0A381NSD3_9ZZZZ
MNKVYRGGSLPMSTSWALPRQFYSVISTLITNVFILIGYSFIQFNSNIIEHFFIDYIRN